MMPAGLWQSRPWAPSPWTGANMKNWMRASSITRTASTLSTCPPTLMSRKRAWISHSNVSPMAGSSQVLAGVVLGDSAMVTRVRTSVEDGVAVVTLDGDDDLNLFSSATAGELGATLARLDGDEDVRVVVLTGAGRAFCAGADLAAGSGAFEERDSFSASPVRPAPAELST